MVSVVRTAQLCWVGCMELLLTQASSPNITKQLLSVNVGPPYFLSFPYFKVGLQTDDYFQQRFFDYLPIIFLMN